MDFFNSEKWEMDKTGVYLSSEKKVETAFTDKAQDDLWGLEDESWWFQYRARMILDLVSMYFDPAKLIVDVGGGNGYTSSVAAKMGYRTGLIEPSIKACHHAKQRGIDIVCCGTVANDTVNDESIDQLFLLDVLEHIEDEKLFLKLLHKKIARGGYCLMTVPAFMCLWSSEDTAAGHFRRYRIKSLCRLLEDCGFHICYQSYFMGFLFVPILFIRVLFERIGVIKAQDKRTNEEHDKIMQSQFKVRSDFVNAVLEVIERIEQKLMRKSGRVPFGSSIVIITKRIDHS